MTIIAHPARRILISREKPNGQARARPRSPRRAVNRATGRARDDLTARAVCRVPNGNRAR